VQTIVKRDRRVGKRQLSGKTISEKQQKKRGLVKRGDDHPGKNIEKERGIKYKKEGGTKVHGREQ